PNDAPDCRTVGRNGGCPKTDLLSDTLFPMNDPEDSVPTTEMLDLYPRVRHRRSQNYTRAHNVAWQVDASHLLFSSLHLSCLIRHMHVKETTARPDRHSILWPSHIRQQLPQTVLYTY